MTSRSFALVSCAQARDLDTDLPLLVNEFIALGQHVQIVDWDDPTLDWTQFDVTIVRSPWDYHERYAEFLQWIDRVSMVTHLLNSPDVLRWNTDKCYLTDVIDAGIAVIPTSFLTTQADVEMFAFADDVVLKPTVSAGSNNTHRFVNDVAAAAKCAGELVAQGRVVMVQPYQISIDEMGRPALCILVGNLATPFAREPFLAPSHALRIHYLYRRKLVTPRLEPPNFCLVGQCWNTSLLGLARLRCMRGLTWLSLQTARQP